MSFYKSNTIVSMILNKHKLDWTVLEPKDTCARRTGKLIFGSLCIAAVEVAVLVEFAVSALLLILAKSIGFFIPKQYTWFQEKVFQPSIEYTFYSLCNVGFFMNFK